MVYHPETAVDPESKFPQGQFVLKLFKPDSIARWSAKSAGVRFFRNVNLDGSLDKIIRKRPCNTVIITDDPERFEQVSLKEKIVMDEQFQRVPVPVPAFSEPFCAYLSHCETGRLLKITPVKPISVMLVNIRNPGDKRWDSMGLPSSARILMGALKKAKYDVRYRNLHVDTDPRDFVFDCDCIGIGVYDDTILETIKLLNRIRSISDLPIMLGGPMVTLAPDYVAAHCDQADAFLRGEAEETLPELIHALFIERKQHGLMPLIDMSGIKGLYAAGDTWGVSGQFPETPRPENFERLDLFVDTGTTKDLRSGLEYSTSRGCPRACVFCSRIHGKKVRVYPDSVIRRHLETVHDAFSGSASKTGIAPDVFTVNINDDDLLMDPDRALRILELCRVSGFRIWGIQTSIDSLCANDTRERLFTILSGEPCFAGSQPLFWIGTDAFTSVRLKRFGKPGTSRMIENICDDIDRSGFLGYHYWIVTDAETDWPEFIDELFFLNRLSLKYPDSFRILPNSPTLIPYPSTPVYARRMNRKQHDRIVLKSILRIPGSPELDYPVVLHERPRDDYLYAMVEPFAVTPENLYTHPERFLNDIRENRVNNAIMECLRVLNMEIEVIQNSARKRELNRIRERILSYWTRDQDGLE
jgi:radical SAM superfamily enzyme YgiQ (UPF0313 family)